MKIAWSQIVGMLGDLLAHWGHSLQDSSARIYTSTPEGAEELSRWREHDYPGACWCGRSHGGLVPVAGIQTEEP